MPQDAKIQRKSGLERRPGDEQMSLVNQSVNADNCREVIWAVSVRVLYGIALTAKRKW